MKHSHDVRQLDCLTVHDLQAAADGQRQRAVDLSLPPQVRQTAANQAAVFSALARVCIYETLPPCALRDIKLPEAQRELEAALRDGEAGHQKAVRYHEYGQRAHQWQLTGYVARYSTFQRVRR
jgi:hypothetical protein